MESYQIYLNMEGDRYNVPEVDEGVEGECYNVPEVDEGVEGESGIMYLRLMRE